MTASIIMTTKIAMSELISQYNQRLRLRYLKVANTRCTKFDFLGGRRSGKSYFIEQVLLGRMLRGEVVNVATMTSEQGRLGVYSDCLDIIAGSPSVQQYVDVKRTPRQIECKLNRGRMFFNSYPDPERAKGIACDWLYINEANNFTERQYIDLSASVRRGTFADRNPNSHCWTETNGFQLIHSTWKDNDYLTKEQREWFDMLKRKAEAPNATAVDKALYRMYYLGEYADMTGEIFTPANIRFVDKEPKLLHFIIFIDPSALRGNDYTAIVLAATDGQGVYIIDTISENSGGDSMRVELVRRLRSWLRSYDVEKIFVETNGEIGVSFYEYLQNSEIYADGWNSRGNKFERIVANYSDLTSRLFIIDTPQNRAYMEQVYQFREKCEHDDNIDAINSCFNAYKWVGLI